MRRRISLLLAAALAGTTLVLLGPAQPSGAVLLCAGQGGVSVAPGLLYPILGGITGGPMKDHVVDVLIGDDNTTHGFVFNISAGGACVHVAIPPTVGSGLGHGVLKGYCGHSSGTGTLNGQPFSFIESGGVVLLTGHVVGGGHIMPALGTGSCAHFEPLTQLPSGATTFIVTLAGASLNCNNALPPQETLTRLIDQDFLVVEPTTGISLLGVHVHLGLHAWTTPICTSPDVLL